MPDRILAEPLDVAIAAGVATVTLNRPTVRNAFDDDLITRLCQTFETLGADGAVRAVVIAGAGPVFCAGGDLAWMRRAATYDAAANLADARGLARLMRTLDLMPKPTLARVQGAAYAGALGLVAAVDIAVATMDARFSVSEVRLGLIPAVISPYLVRAMGPRRCRQLVLTGEIFDGRAAAEWGLVHDVVAGPDDLDAAIARYLAALALGAPGALAAAKGLLATVSATPLDDALIQRTAEGIARQRATPEGKEGVGAFLERRKPAWVDAPR